MPAFDLGTQMNRATAVGFLLFLSGAATSASLFASLRIEIAGMLVHPYLFLLIPAFLLAASPLRCPGLAPIAKASALYILAATSIVGLIGLDISHSIRLAVFASTAVLIASIVARRPHLAVWLLSGIALSALTISVVGLAGVESVANVRGGLDPTRGVGNRNTPSLYTLPGVLAAVTLLAMDLRRRLLVTALAFATIAAVTAFTLGSGNRSGWIGLAFIALVALVRPGELLQTRPMRQIGTRFAIMCALGLAGVALLGRTYGFATFEDRLVATSTGQDSTGIRLEIYRVMARHAAEYPFGRPPSSMFEWIAAQIGSATARLDPHSMFLFVLGTAGIWGLAAFLIFITSTLAVAIKPPTWRLENWFALSLTLLWCVRGAFQSDALFAPSFAFGFGLVASGVAISSSRSRGDRTSQPGLRSPSPGFAGQDSAT
jgi:O-antigen ligase